LLSKPISSKKLKNGESTSNRKRKNTPLSEAAASGQTSSVDGDAKEQRISKREKS
jgi:hypothetical protein